MGLQMSYTSCKTVQRTPDFAFASTSPGGERTANRQLLAKR